MLSFRDHAVPLARYYVPHTVADHTSLLALIEKRFMTSAIGHEHDGDADDGDLSRPHLTKRDLFASTLEDLFDFDHAPSLLTQIGTALRPADDCTPAPRPAAAAPKAISLRGDGRGLYRPGDLCFPTLRAQAALRCVSAAAKDEGSALAQWRA
jgi:hypothetical protein